MYALEPERLPNFLGPAPRHCGATGPGDQGVGGLRSAQGRAFSSCPARRKSALSSPRRAANWIPMGSPFAFQHRGTDMAGCPDALKTWVYPTDVSRRVTRVGRSGFESARTPSFSGGAP